MQNEKLIRKIQKSSTDIFYLAESLLTLEVLGYDINNDILTIAENSIRVLAILLEQHKKELQEEHVNEKHGYSTD